MNKQNRNNFIDTENKLIVTKGEGFGGLDKKGIGIEKYRLVVKNRYGDVKCSIKDIVSNDVGCPPHTQNIKDNPLQSI